MKLGELPHLQIEGSHTLNDRGNLLPVSAHILHRRSAHSPRNAGETFQPGASKLYCPLNAALPRFARVYAEQIAVPLYAL